MSETLLRNNSMYETLLGKLKCTPRWHFLKAIKDIYKTENSICLDGIVYFSSEIPTIADRAGKYLELPHVNLTDCAHAFWNVGHLLAIEYKLGNIRTLKGEVIFRAIKQIFPDEEYLIKSKVCFQWQKQNILRGYLSGALYNRDDKKTFELIQAPFCVKQEK
jgi:hypothetical protein